MDLQLPSTHAATRDGAGEADPVVAVVAVGLLARLHTLIMAMTSQTIYSLMDGEAARAAMVALKLPVGMSLMRPG
jgi:hypothetical protein